MDDRLACSVVYVLLFAKGPLTFEEANRRAKERVAAQDAGDLIRAEAVLGRRTGGAIAEPRVPRPSEQGA